MITSEDVQTFLKYSRQPPKSYESITNLYLSEAGFLNPINSLNTGIQGFQYLETNEVVWPRAANTYLNRTRARNKFAEEEGYNGNGYDRKTISPEAAKMNNWTKQRRLRRCTKVTRPIQTSIHTNQNRQSNPPLLTRNGGKLQCKGYA